MITSTANPQIKSLIQLQKKARARREQDLFLVEGPKMYQEAPRDRLIKTYVSASFYEKNEKNGIRQTKDLELLSDRVFEAVSDTQTPQGVLCLVRRQHYTLEELLQKQPPLLMILENLQDPGNLGTILRTAEGAGVTGIVLGKDCVDLYNPKTIRSTMGSIYRMPVYHSENLRQDVEKLKSRGVNLYAAHLQGREYYSGKSFAGPTGFFIGNESRGLSDELAALADTYIKIPMDGQVESLNAAVAAAVLMYEARRQRHQEKK